MYSCTAIWSPASKVQSSGSAYLYSAVARAISGFAGGAEGARFGREGAAGVLYAGGGGSLRRMLLKALVGTGAGTGAWACTGVGLLRADPPSEDSAGRAAMILS